MTASGNDSFGDAAGEMANETEVESSETGAGRPAEEPAPARDGDSAPADPARDPEAAEDPDTSSAEDMVEEGGPVQSASTPSAEDQLAERTADLQRLQAEYANYRKRVERDRQLVAENATYQVLVPIIDVLDTVDRAREHGELDEGFKAVADQLERVVAGLGLTRFGTPGEEFDPNLHEALSHLGEDAEVQVTTVKVLAKAGYRIGDRVVRAAQVLVVDPA